MCRLNVRDPFLNNEYFRHHLQDKLHFIALGKEDKDNGIRVNLLATSEEIARRVLTAFNWQQTGDLIFLKYSSP